MRKLAAGIGAAAAVGGLMAGVALFGWWFFGMVLDGESPSTFWWVVTGILTFSLGSLVGVGIARLLKLDESGASAASGISGLVVLAIALGGSYVWLRTHEGPLATTLGPVCEGEAVDAAADLDRSGTNQFVVLDAAGHEMSWTVVDETWRAEEPEDAALVACVAERDAFVERCTYRSPSSGVHDISRYAEVLAVRVVEARTGERLGRFTLRDEPRKCRQVEQEGQGDLHGDVALEDLVDAMQPYANLDAGS